jgi:pSer/pThr/pTyr-binding forkhead associated (FHA) protein
MYKLELKLQSLTLKEYALANGAKLAIGRHSGSEIVLNDMAVSRHHATIEVQGQKLLVFDQGSKNGIIVNGKKVQSAQLKPGDIVRIGSKFTIEVSVPPPKKREATLTGEHAKKAQ